MAHCARLIIYINKLLTSMECVVSDLNGIQCKMSKQKKQRRKKKERKHQKHMQFLNKKPLTHTTKEFLSSFHSLCAVSIAMTFEWSHQLLAVFLLCSLSICATDKQNITKARESEPTLNRMNLNYSFSLSIDIFIQRSLPYHTYEYTQSHMHTQHWLKRTTETT